MCDVNTNQHGPSKVPHLQNVRYLVTFLAPLDSASRAHGMEGGCLCPSSVVSIRICVAITCISFKFHLQVDIFEWSSQKYRFEFLKF